MGDAGGVAALPVAAATDVLEEGAREYHNPVAVVNVAGAALARVISRLYGAERRRAARKARDIADLEPDVEEAT